MNWIELIDRFIKSRLQSFVTPQIILKSKLYSIMKPSYWASFPEFYHFGFHHITSPKRRSWNSLKIFKFFDLLIKFFFQRFMWFNLLWLIGCPRPDLWVSRPSSKIRIWYFRWYFFNFTVYTHAPIHITPQENQTCARIMCKLFTFLWIVVCKPSETAIVFIELLQQNIPGCWLTTFSYRSKAHSIWLGNFISYCLI